MQSKYKHPFSPALPVIFAVLYLYKSEIALQVVHFTPHIVQYTLQIVHSASLRSFNVLARH